MVKIHYLYNSGFTVETEKHFLIFDYYMDSVKKGPKILSNGAVSVEDLPKEKTIVVFSSHSHHDHFNPVIYKWQAFRSDIKYVLSSDIAASKKINNIYRMDPYEKVEINSVIVKSFGSTDLGGSFLVEVDGCSVFHAGDLNWWYWWDDTEEEIEKMETWFKSEINRLVGEKIDIAFFPVDPRLKHNYCIGAKYFIEQLKPKFLIPMHFGENYETTVKFNKETIGFEVKIMEISHRGQQFELFGDHTP